MKARELTEREERIAWKAFEIGVNDGAWEGLQSFCDGLLALAEEETVLALPTGEALRRVAHSMRQAGNVEFSLGENPPSGQLRFRLLAAIAVHLKKRGPTHG